MYLILRSLGFQANKIKINLVSDLKFSCHRHFLNHITLFNQLKCLLVSCEFCKVSKNSFFKEHLWATSSNKTNFKLRVSSSFVDFPLSVMQSSKQYRSSRPEVFCKKSALRNFPNSEENSCIRASFLIKLQA